jgi:hypothetical protein
MDDEVEAEVHGITFPRSDGVEWCVAEKKKGQGQPPRVYNGPTHAQCDPKPDAKGNVDYYRLLDADDDVAQDWRSKIGDMLMRLLGGPEQEGKFIRAFYLFLKGGAPKRFYHTHTSSIRTRYRNIFSNSLFFSRKKSQVGYAP